MKKILLGFLAAVCAGPILAQVAPDVDAWEVNTTGEKASYWQNTGSGMNTEYTFNESTELADVQSVCYTNDSMWIKSTGMTDNMGKFSNPGAPTNQNYTWRLPRQAAGTPNEAVSKDVVPDVFAIGILINGVPMYGKGDGNSWSTSSNTNTGMGDGVWVGDAWYSEGFTLDSTLGAHPQQDGGYHSHATPYRLYEDVPASQHSPIVGFALDGYPVYGPYGYSDSLNSSSSITRMTSSYQLRSISQRHRLAGETTDRPSSEWGPDVSPSHPLGEYVQDYEYIEGLGTLDEYNGRWCVTPEYPSGIYAYFVTTEADGSPAFPYYIGLEYYGQAELDNSDPSSNITVPTTGTTCIEGVASNDTGDLEDISPGSGQQNTSVTVTFSFADDVDPSTPPNNVPPDAITLNGVSGINISRDGTSGDVTVTFDLTGIAPGKYDIVVTFNPPAGSAITYTGTDIFEVTSGPLATTGAFDANVIVYPNPSTGVVYINGMAGSYNIVVCNGLGDVVNEVTGDGNTAALDLSEGGSGVYYLTVSSGNQVTTKKVIIQ